MKKILSILVVAIILFVTGCGNTKTLECKIDVSGVEQTMTFEYDDDNIKNVEMVMFYSASSLEEESISKDQVDTYTKMVEDSFCSTYTSYEGINCYAKSDNGAIKLIVEIKYSELSEDTKNTFGYTNDAYDDLKKDFESKGYTCK